MTTIHRLRAAAVAGLTLLALASIAGCSAAGDSPANGVAFVVGARANTPAVDPDRLLEFVPGDLAEFPVGSIVSVTGVDGTEDGVAGVGFKLKDLDTDADNGDLLLAGRGNVAEGLGTLEAEVSEANVLGAIATAARSLSTITGSKTLVVADSMLSTIDPIAFQTGLLQSSGVDVLASIPEGLLPPLDGFRVVIIDQGTTEAPQLPLSQLDRTALREIWETVLFAAGAESIEYDDRSTPMDSPSYAVQVTPVEPTKITGPVVKDCRVVIPEQAIRFNGNLATFVSPADAHNYIVQVADGLRGCSGTITISGTTASASDDDDFNHALSLERATTVRAELAPLMSLELDDIAVEGLGTDFPGFIDDRPNGVFDAILGAQNRTVIVSYAG